MCYREREFVALTLPGLRGRRHRYGWRKTKYDKSCGIHPDLLFPAVGSGELYRAERLGKRFRPGTRWRKGTLAHPAADACCFTARDRESNFGAGASVICSLRYGIRGTER